MPLKNLIELYHDVLISNRLQYVSTQKIINVNSMNLIYLITSNYLLRSRHEICDRTPGEGVAPLN